MSIRASVAPAPAPRLTPAAAAAEHRHTFDCFGGQCTVIVSDARRPADAAAAVTMVKRTLLEWHRRFTRFSADGELAALNGDPREQVPVTPLMRRLVGAALEGARYTGGLVDATLGDEIGRAGYELSWSGVGIPLEEALAIAPARTPAGPSPRRRWAQISVDRRHGTVSRPPGVRFDLGGIAKGVFADELSAGLAGFDAYALDLAGDIRLGGRALMRREVRIESPFGDDVLHRFELAGGAVATSGIGRRSWRTEDGAPAHHLLDPRTGRPAFTGVVQATALATTATQAEALAKAAVLSGPRRAAGWLAHGGVLVFDDGRYAVLEPAASRPATLGR